MFAENSRFNKVFSKGLEETFVSQKFLFSMILFRVPGDDRRKKYIALWLQYESYTGAIKRSKVVRLVQ